MAIMIKGMEMPTRCGECPCAYSTEGAYWDTCQAVDDQKVRRRVSILLAGRGWAQSSGDTGGE